MAIVTFNIASKGGGSSSSRDRDGDSADISRTATALSSDTEGSAKWQEGRAGRIRSLEAALEASLSCRRHSSQHLQPGATANYQHMLEGEDISYDGASHGDDDDGNSNDSLDSDSSSDFYGEGQPLLRTYHPPEILGTGYGSAKVAAATTAATATTTAKTATTATTAAAAPKTPGQFLPWDVRLRERIWSLYVASCCCSQHSNEHNGG